MKIIEAKSDSNIKIVSLKKTVEVVATAKSGHKTGSKRKVSELQAENLLKRGMIENFNAKPKTTKKEE